MGNALGAGKTAEAQLSSKVAVVCAAVSLIFCGFNHWDLWRMKSAIFFTNDMEIVARVKDVMVFLSCLPSLWLHSASVTGGIIRGAGKQMIGAGCNLVGYYFVGLPIGVSLMFAAHLGIVGLWVGFPALFIYAGSILHHIPGKTQLEENHSGGAGSGRSAALFQCRGECRAGPGTGYTGLLPDPNSGGPGEWGLLWEQLFGPGEAQ